MHYDKESLLKLFVMMMIYDKFLLTKMSFKLTDSSGSGVVGSGGVGSGVVGSGGVASSVIHLM